MGSKCLMGVVDVWIEDVFQLNGGGYTLVGSLKCHIYLPESVDSISQNFQRES